MLKQVGLLKFIHTAGAIGQDGLKEQVIGQNFCISAAQTPNGLQIKVHLSCETLFSVWMGLKMDQGKMEIERDIRNHSVILQEVRGHM